jgi:hypothetical protein
MINIDNAPESNMGKRTQILEASRHQVAVINYCEQARIDANRGKRDMAFWCLDMAARHRRHYIKARSALNA